MALSDSSSRSRRSQRSAPSICLAACRSRFRASDDASPVVAGGTAPDPVWRFLALLQAVRTDVPTRPKRNSRRWAA